ncbi:hypothetical protein YC2023_079542 [Brassica napus]
MVAPLAPPPVKVMAPKACVTAKSRREAAVGQVETVCVVDLCGGLCRFGVSDLLRLDPSWRFA